MLGNDEGGNHYKKAELKSFLQFHRQGEEPLRDDEITILNGVLSLNDKRVDAIMTPMKVRINLQLRKVSAAPTEALCDRKDVVTLSSDAVLDHKKVDTL